MNLFRCFNNPSFGYSTDEQVIGTWIDGKPVYQKTIEFGALPNATEKSVNHGISNLKYVISYDCIGAQTVNYRTQIPVPQTSISAFKYQQTIWFDKNKVYIECAEDLSSAYTMCYVTLQYTKTTD